MQSMASGRRAAMQRAKQVRRFDTAYRNSRIRAMPPRPLLSQHSVERQRGEETGGSSKLTNSDGLDAGSFEDAEHGAYARDATRIPRSAHVLCASPVD